MAVPLTFNGPSMRGCALPITDICALSGIIEMSILSLGSLGRELQCMYKAAFG